MIDFYQEDRHSTTVSTHHKHVRITAKRTDREVLVRFATTTGRDCDLVETAFESCFTCEEWDRLLCELGRVCDPDPCQPCDCDEPTKRPFDQDEQRSGREDDCDDEHKSITVNVGALQKKLKGLPITASVEITE